MMIGLLHSVPGRITRCARDNRRRILFASLLAFIAGNILYTSVSGLVFGLPVPVFAGLLYAGIVGPAAFLTCLFLPALSVMVESVAVSRLFFAFTVTQFPETGHKIAASPFATATFVVGGAILLQFLCRRVRAMEPVAGRLRQPA